MIAFGACSTKRLVRPLIPMVVVDVQFSCRLGRVAAAVTMTRALRNRT